VVPSWTPRFSPQYYWADVSDRSVQQAFRHAFVRWGLPGCVRVDNGKPWGSWSDLPPALALWLIGLGITVVWNDACCPQQNGVVERSQGTSKRWAEPHKCSTPEEAQQRLSDDDVLQRERYPVVRGQTRIQLYPALAHTGRAYREADEAALWSMAPVREHLGEYAVSRRVCRGGKVSVYNRHLYVGVIHAGKTVWVQYDPDQEHWVISADDGQQLRSKPATEINTASICQLQVQGPK
jgi:hypothetical protein